MKFSQNFFKKIYQRLIFIAAFLLVANSLVAFPNRTGEYGDEEKSKEQQQAEQERQQRARMREATEEGDATSSSDDIEAAFRQANDQLAAWHEDPSSIQDDALNVFIEFWLGKVTQYNEARNENTSAENNEAAQRNLDYFNKSHEILAAANELKEAQYSPLIFANASLGNSLNNQLVQSEFSAGAENQASQDVGRNNRGEGNPPAAPVSSFLDYLPPLPSLKQAALGAVVSFLSYRAVDKHIPNFLSNYCPPYSDSVASWHPCSGFPNQANLSQLAAFKTEVSLYMPPGFPLVNSLVVGGHLLEDPSRYYQDAARSVDCGEGKTFCYAFLPKEAALIEFPEGANCSIYNTSCYEKWGSDNKVLKHYQEFGSRLQQQEKKFSALTFNLPSEAGYFASRAWKDFSSQLQNIKNIYATARLTASAKKEATLAFIARQIRTAVTHDQSNRLSDGAVVISHRSQEIRAALRGEKDQYDQAVSSWKKAREANKRGLAAAPKYEKEGWFSKEDWRHYLQDLTYRITELQYWQSHTLQRIIEDNLRRVTQFGSEKLSDLNNLRAQNEATRSEFTETVGGCYQLVDTVTHVDSYNPYRLHAMTATSSAGNSTILRGGQLYEAIAQRVKILCDTFQQSLQENNEKNQRLIEALKTSEQGSEDSQAF